MNASAGCKIETILFAYFTGQQILRSASGKKVDPRDSLLAMRLEIETKYYIHHKMVKWSNHITVNKIQFIG